jgi:hypothetical protein
MAARYCVTDFGEISLPRKSSPKQAGIFHETPELVLGCQAFELHHIVFGDEIAQPLAPHG